MSTDRRPDIKPNFLIVGAAKSGTTSLYHYLSRHDDIFLSTVRKEGRHFSGVGDGSVYWPAYYSFDTAPGWADYQTLFAAHDGQARIGDTSPDYLAYAHRTAPAVMDRLGPDTRIIAILRDPVSRAWSHYLQNVRREAEFFSFEKTLDLEAERAAAGWGFQWLYALNGRYADQLPHFMDRFDPLILLQEELDADAPGVVARILDYLDLPSRDAPPTEGRFNTGGIPADKSAILQGALDHRAAESFETLHAELGAATPDGPSADGVYPPVKRDEIVYPALSEASRARLDMLLRPSIDRLSALLDRDLSHWGRS
ncbi:MAG: sulfotransferase [Pseudomonadota bacterium]